MKKLKKIFAVLSMVLVITPVTLAATWIDFGDDGKGANPVYKYYPQVDIREVKYKIENGVLYFKVSVEKEWDTPKYPVEKWYINVGLDTKKGGLEWYEFAPDYTLLVWKDWEGKIYTRLFYYDEKGISHELGKLDYIDITGNTIEIGVKTERIERIEKPKIAIQVAGAYEEFKSAEWKHVDVTETFYIDSGKLKSSIPNEVESVEESPQTPTGLIIYRGFDPFMGAVIVLIAINLVLTSILLRKLYSQETSKQEFREIKVV